jgi:tetratricopeptide (TPR) repeat protein
MKSHFFISRSGEDSESALWIAKILEAEGHSTTLQDLDFKPGQSFLHQMKLAEDRASHFIALLSPQYLAKPFTLSELYSAVADDPIGENRLLIPVRVVPCEIPRLIKHIIYIDFVGKDEAQRKHALLQGIAPAREAVPSREVRTSIQKLPAVDPHVVGRDTELDWLEQAWSNAQTNFIQIIAPGGTGKTALATRWYRRHLDNVTVFGWSFYSQGTSEKSETSSDSFVTTALRWFGITFSATESVFTKVDLLVASMRRERTLLILDGIEPLQEADGSLRDLALKALLQELAVRNSGMALVTTRVRLADLLDDPPHAISLDLENLAPADGARYLAHLGVRGPEEELCEASEAYGNHALALTLLGTYLVTFCEADIRRRADTREFEVDDTQPGRHARHVMASYARMYAGKPELDILCALGYFDRPAEREALKLVLPEIGERKYRAAIQHLRGARLIVSTNPTQLVDCHPLVRKYFAAAATREGHARLYEHYKKEAPPYPNTLKEMTPLFYAIYHGCKAGEHQAAVQDVYYDRIDRGTEFYLTNKLGAYGTELSLLGNFFEAPWTHPESSLSPADRSWVLGNSGFALRAVGRLTDAVEPTRASAEADVESKEWQNAAVSYSNLSGLYLTIGNIPEAITHARQAFDFAERSGDWSERMIRRTTLADALHHAGDRAEATQLFRDAERLQAVHQPEYPILNSLPGYWYCELLLEQGETAQVLRRASQAMLIAKAKRTPLDIGLAHLLLGRINPTGSVEAAHHLDLAVDFLRLAGLLDYLPRGLLARAKRHDLDSAFRLAIRSGMRLHLSDYHLISARRALDGGDRVQAQAHFEQAEILVKETGYHRRDPDLAWLLAALGG